MAVRVPVPDLPNVLKMLEKYLPDSNATYTAVKLIIHGLTGYQVFVDECPEGPTVLVTTDKEAKPEQENCTFLFCLDDRNLGSLLDQSGISNKPYTILMSVRHDILLKVKGILSKSRTSPLEEVFRAEPQFYYANSVIQPPKLPEGFAGRALTPGDAETIIDGVQYKVSDYCKSIKRVLEIGTLSSVGVENKDGELVAWTLQHITGTIGMTYVKPEYRGLKLGKYVTAVLARSIIEREGFCITGIEKGNSVSVNLHEGVGFKKVDRLYTSAVFQRRG